MSSLKMHNSEESLEENQELNEDITEIGLPKSCLNSFVKEILTKNKVRGDRNIIPMLDKISKLYVTHLSSLGCKICADSKKKTLNVEHIIEALKTMNFNDHIKLIVKANNGETDFDKYSMLEDEKKNVENKVLKQFINKKQKRKSRKKKCFENEDERDQIKEMQAAMFEEARRELDAQMNQIQNQNANDENFGSGNDLQNEEKNEAESDKKQNYEDIDKDDILINKGGDEDINFD